MLHSRTIEVRNLNANQGRKFATITINLDIKRLESIYESTQ